MTSQRDPGKEIVGGFYPEDLKKDLKDLAHKQKTNLSQVLLNIIIRFLTQEGYDVSDKALAQLSWTEGIPKSLMARIEYLPPPPPRKRRKRQPDGTLK